MENVKESVAYLQGMAKGLHIDESAPEGKLLMRAIDVLADIAQEIGEVRAAQESLEEYMAAVDGDLSDLEEAVYDESFKCNEDFVELQCPSCQREISFDSAILESRRNIEVTCPYCSSVVYDNIIDGDCVYESEYVNPGI
jgi:DNA-directed RNA polymerase subunit RPC12/RpoP